MNAIKDYEIYSATQCELTYILNDHFSFQSNIMFDAFIEAQNVVGRAF